MSPLRILHVTPYCEHAWAYGGVPRVVGALSAGLAARGHLVTVCTTDARLAHERLRAPAGGSPWQPWIEQSSDGVTLRVFPNVSNRVAYDLQLFLPIGLSRYLREHAAEFDVGHIHACRNIPGTLASRHLSRAGVPYILQPHGTAPRIERRFLTKALFDATLGRGVVKRAAAVLAVTQAERRQLRGMGIADRQITIVPNPVDLAEFALPIDTGAFRNRIGLTSERIVLFLGKLTPRKRLDVLVKAFAAMRRPDTRLVIAGNDMGYGQQLQQLVLTLGIERVTILTGLISGRERLEALADADVVAYASKDEIFGLVPIEALLCGTPVVVAGDSGCGEVVAHLGGGLVVQEGHVAALAAAISSILDSPERWRAAALAARQRIAGFCGSSTVCEQVEAVYQRVAAGPPR